jgi:thiol-disulfide isomerase/thioredoxin
MLNRLSICIVLIVLSLTTTAQKRFSVKVKFPANLDKSKIKFHMDDGKNTFKELKPPLLNDEVIISDEYFSKYATLTIDYETEPIGYGNSFWIGEKEATINFLPDNEATKNPLKNLETENAYELTKMGEQQLNEYYKDELDDFAQFVFKHRENMNDSLVQIAIEKAIIKNKKIIDFVRKNGKLYYSFWLFRNRIVTDMDADPDSLLHIYNTVFDDSLRNSEEGKEIVKYLNGRRLQERSNYADFTAKDIDGKIITLSQRKSKYVLLTFWASWCGPCAKEMEDIRALRKKYKADDLEIISVTWDKNYDEFITAVKEYKLNWIHIFEGDELTRTYGVVGIPELFLIDTNEKKIIYKFKEFYKQDVENINKILTERL